MPWQASAADFAKHPLDSTMPDPLPKHRLPPTDMPPIAFHFTDDNAHPGTQDPWHPLSDDDTRAARRAYRAAVTGMDRKLGTLLDELDTLGLTDSVAVVLHGDHG